MQIACDRCGSLSPDLPDLTPNTKYICRRCTPRRRTRYLDYDYRVPVPKRLFTPYTESELQAAKPRLIELGEVSRNDLKDRTLRLLQIFGDSSRLSEPERRVFSLYLCEGRTVRDVAELTGISKSNVRTMAERACRKLRASLTFAKYERNPSKAKLDLCGEIEEIVTERDAEHDDLEFCHIDGESSDQDDE